VAKRFDGDQVFPYILSQAIGAFLASGILRLLFLDTITLGETLPAGPWWQTFILEIIL